MKMHEYQNKGITKKAFRNCLILKDAISVVCGQEKPDWLL